MFYCSNLYKFFILFYLVFSLLSPFFFFSSFFFLFLSALLSLPQSQVNGSLCSALSLSLAATQFVEVVVGCICGLVVVWWPWISWFGGHGFRGPWGVGRGSPAWLQTKWVVVGLGLPTWVWWFWVLVYLWLN